MTRAIVLKRETLTNANLPGDEGRHPHDEGHRPQKGDRRPRDEGHRPHHNGHCCQKLVIPTKKSWKHPFQVQLYILKQNPNNKNRLELILTR